MKEKTITKKYEKVFGHNPLAYVDYAKYENMLIMFAEYKKAVQLRLHLTAFGVGMLAFLVGLWVAWSYPLAQFGGK